MRFLSRILLALTLGLFTIAAPTGIASTAAQEPFQGAPPGAFRGGIRPDGPKPEGSEGKGGKPEENPKQGGEGGAPANADKAAQDEKGPEPKIIRRDGLDISQGDPAELATTVGDDGKVSFRFRNQGWVELVGWLSDISSQPIDWQELPGDAVNLVSPERLSIAETADLINRHLLARGYTMLQLEGGITITKTSTINPGVVHRVGPEELEKLPDHTYVRTMLDAGWLSAEKLAVELKPMLSASGQLTALATTNRLEAMDAAVNLRQVARLLSEERDVASRDALAPEFRLRHIPAEEAKQLLEQFLGVEKKEAAPMSREQMQMMQRMQQQGQGGPPQPPKPESQISIVANVRQNSVLVRAPIDRVAIAAEFIKRIDVPGGSLRSLADASSRVDVFRLVSLDPDKLVTIAQEMNVLEPTTRIRVDKDNSAVIVSGSAADRFIVKSLIERLDGGKRRFEVLQLRRLEAADVAESISFLMGKDKDDDKSSSRNRYSYYGWGGDADEKKDDDEFRVAANSGYRQVLLWANEAEMEEVRSLLIKLGELPPPGGSGQTVRMIEAAATPETLEYLKRIRAQWQSFAPNELVLPNDQQFVAPKSAGENAGDKKTKDKETEDAAEDDQTPNTPIPNAIEEPAKILKEPIVVDENDAAMSLAKFLGNSAPLDASDLTLTTRPQSPAESTSMQSPSAVSNPLPQRQPAPIEIRLDAEGNLILSSSDTQALDALENMMLDRKPPTRSYHVFRVQNASVALLAIDLEDYFEEDDEKKEEGNDRFSRWFWDDDSSADTGPTGLARRGKLRFIPNSDTGTIIVTGASASQLRTIEELIELWDVAEPVNPKLSRFTKLVTIRYGRSEKIADTVKEAYRDLLSSNDKAFASGGRNRPGENSSSNRGGGSGLEDSDSGRDAGGNDFSFNGKLSLGVDEIGNTLLVSAEGESLLDLIVSMIEKLDKAAQPGGEIEIVRFSGDVSADTLRQAMSSLGVKAADASGENRRSDSRPRSQRDRDRLRERNRD